MKILAITLARSGSKGVKGKNFRNICGKPLLAYTVKETLKSNLIDDYIFSTDSKEIADIANDYGAYTPFLRPKELANDTATSSDALIHALNYMEKENNCKYNYIVETMVTNPLKTVEDIDGTINLALHNKSNSAIAVHQLFDQHPARIKKILDGKIVDFCVKEIPETRRQDLTPKAYIRSGSIYVMSRDMLLNKGLRYGVEDSFAYILPSNRVVNIDEEIDLKYANYMLCGKF